MRHHSKTLATALAAALLAGSVATATAASAAGDVTTDPNDGVPRTTTPVEYTQYPPVTDPGASADGYFQPFWYDTDGRHVQAHGGQVVTVQEGGQSVQYWYGEDRTKGYYNSPGVGVYRSTDGLNWTNAGTALRSVQSPEELQQPYFDAIYDTVDDAGAPRADRIAELNYHLNSNETADYTAIFERPKVLFNEKTGKWVMWWHSDGRTEPGGSTYARSFAAVATSDSPTGPFTLQGAYRLYNRADYQACTTGAVPGQARDMTVFQDDDGTAYISYSSEENRSLYIAKLDADYTNVEKTTTTDTLDAQQYSADGKFPYVFADGSAEAPVRGEDFQIVKECGVLEAPAIFETDGTYHVIASGATGWAPNPATYYTADDLLGTWIRGVEADDVHEDVSYSAIPEGGDGLLAVGDTHRSTFGSQSTNVQEVGPGKYVYMGDRWNSGASDSTYVWLPIVLGEGGRLELRNPAQEDPQRWGKGWDESYWDDHGYGTTSWTVVDDRLPDGVQRGSDAAASLPATVSVEAGGATSDVAVTWSDVDTSYLGQRTVTGTLAAGGGFTKGRTIVRTVDVVADGVTNVASSAAGATATASSRPELAELINDGDPAGKGWDDWTAQGYPHDSWLQLDLAAPLAVGSVDSVVVHTFKDGSTATWPSTIDVQVQDAAGAWVSSGVTARVSQDASGAPPVVVLDGSSLPATSSLRLHLTTTADTWQSISEVEVYAKTGGASA